MLPERFKIYYKGRIKLNFGPDFTVGSINFKTNMNAGRIMNVDKCIIATYMID